MLFYYQLSFLRGILSKKIVRESLNYKETIPYLLGRNTDPSFSRFCQKTPDEKEKRRENSGYFVTDMIY